MQNPQADAAVAALHAAARQQPARRQVYDLVAQPNVQQFAAFGIASAFPPSTEPPFIMQRMDDVNALLRMLNDSETSAVMITGAPGAGKSILAALLYRYLQKLHRGASLRHLIWLRLNSYTTLPDMIAAILLAIDAPEPGLFQLKPEQQISTLLRALRRAQESVLLILDQFELLLYPETTQGVAGRGSLALFLDMLKTELGSSRILLTSYHNPFEGESDEVQARVRSFLVSRISMPEGVTLMRQQGVQGAQEDLSLAWQRCTGHVYALTLLSAVVSLSRVPLSYLLSAPDYQPMWAGDVVMHLTTAVYHFLNPTQRAIARILTLFLEPVTVEGIRYVIGKESTGPLAEQLEQELAYLARTSVVQLVKDSDGRPAYELHATLRGHIQEHYLEGVNSATIPVEPGVEPRQMALAAGHLRVAEYYLSIPWPPIEQRRGLHDVRALIAAVRHLCLARHWQRACDLLFNEKLHRSLLFWGAWNALVGLYSSLLPPFGSITRSDEGTVNGLIGMLYGRLGEAQQSQRYFEQALACQRALGDKQGEITTLINQGELLRLRGDNARARQNFEQALELGKGSLDDDQRCVLLHNLGLLEHRQKHFEASFRNYIEALQLARQLRNEQHLAMILTNLGILLFEQGMHKEALALLIAAQQLRQIQRDPSVSMLAHFLNALEQRMGEEVYLRMRQEALNAQQEVISRFLSLDMRQ